MVWHQLAKNLSCQELPVMSILKEFRDMAGEKGRKAHRPSEPPIYDYQLASKPQRGKSWWILLLVEAWWGAV